MSNLIDLFLIGAPKSGTTAMAKYLDSHPSICISQPKEAGYFIQDTSNSQKVDNYEQTFFPHAKSTDLGKMDCTPLYLANHYSINNILAYNQDAKFIAMLRNPVDLYISFHSQLLFEGFENIKCPQKAWEAQEQRANNKQIPIGCREPFLLQYKHICSNGLHIENVFKHVSPGSVHVIRFDDFKASAKSSYAELLTFLDIPNDNREDFSPVNQRKGTSDLGRILLTVQAIGSKVRKKLNISSGLGIGDLIRKIAHSKCRTDSTATKASPEFLAHLQNSFNSDIQLIEQYTNFDLDSWKNKYV